MQPTKKTRQAYMSFASGKTMDELVKTLNLPASELERVASGLDAKLDTWRTLEHLLCPKENNRDLPTQMMEKLAKKYFDDLRKEGTNMVVIKRGDRTVMTFIPTKREG